MDHLPVEVVARIIEETVSLKNEDRAKYKNQIRDLMLTCSLWNSIVNDTPAIWSRIDWNDGRAFVEAAIQKSRNHPLTICYNPETVDDEHEDRDTWFMETIAENSHRWWDVSLTTSDNPNHVVITASAPMLRSFELMCDGEEGGGVYETQLFAGPVPSLDSLTIFRFDYGLDPQALTALEYLNITFEYWDRYMGTSEEHEISPDILAAILRNNPNLRRVFLEGYRPSDMEWEDPEPTDGNPIDLPQLQTMELTNMTMSYVRAIVPFVLFPNSHAFSLKIYDEKEFWLVLPQNWAKFGTLHDAKVLIEVTESAMAVSVCGDQPEDITVDYGHDLDRLDQEDSQSSLIENDYPNLKCISAFLESLSPSVRASLWIRVDLDLAEESAIKTCLRRIPYLSGLGLKKLSENIIIAFLEFLSEGPEYPFPGLKTLAVEPSDEEFPAAAIEPLLEMLRVRKTDPSISQLEILNIPTLESSDVSQITDIVGEGILNLDSYESEDGEDEGEGEEDEDGDGDGDGDGDEGESEEDGEDEEDIQEHSNQEAE